MKYIKPVCFMLLAACEPQTPELTRAAPPQTQTSVVACSSYANPEKFDELWQMMTEEPNYGDLLEPYVNGFKAGMHNEVRASLAFGRELLPIGEGKFVRVRLCTLSSGQ